MVTIVVGHRGSGKSKFLERIKGYYGDFGLEIHTFDLDKEIENTVQKTIGEIFSESGEAGFRILERECFQKLYSHVEKMSGTVYLAVGGGFAGELPLGAQVLWVRRPTDHVGRIFVDRPRLNRRVSAITEFQERFSERETRFKRWHHRQITVPEGWDFANVFEPVVLGLVPSAVNVSVTVLPEHLNNALRFEDFIYDKIQIGIKYFELRNDLLSDIQIENITKEISAEKVLISFRQAPTQKLIALSGPYVTDWAIELGPSPLDHNDIVSAHDRLEGESIDEVVARLKSVKADHYKLAVNVRDYIELWTGHRFFNEHTEKHSFLPNSSDGRWQWYRLAQNKRMKLNFVRDGAEGSSADQPLLFDFVRYPDSANTFAAILGSPVDHSHTPSEQSEFFAKKKMGVVAIDMPEADCHALSFSILEKMGLRAAAVTSPLKMLAARVCAHLDKKSSQLGAINTMLLTSSGWSGTNTDLTGLEIMLKTLELPNSIAVWGGGGTRLVLKSLLPNAHFFSARLGKEIWIEKSEPELNPEVVVWALGRSRLEGSETPPKHWRPTFVLDLNYSEDSPGLEFASLTGAKYISGRAFFKAQAGAQREFWLKEMSGPQS